MDRIDFWYGNGNIDFYNENGNDIYFDMNEENNDFNNKNDGDIYFGLNKENNNFDNGNDNSIHFDVYNWNIESDKIEIEKYIDNVLENVEVFQDYWKVLDKIGFCDDKKNNNFFDNDNFVE